MGRKEGKLQYQRVIIVAIQSFSVLSNFSQCLYFFETEEEGIETIIIQAIIVEAIIIQAIIVEAIIASNCSGRHASKEAIYSLMVSASNCSGRQSSQYLSEVLGGGSE